VVNAISVDLEDWYHICDFDNSIMLRDWEKYHIRLESNVCRILSIFDQFNIHATFFVVGMIAKNSPELIKRIATAGHEVATHGFSHRRIFNMTKQEFENDLLESKKYIEMAAGKEVLGYRAPEWSLKRNNIWALDILKKHGFRYDASAVPLSHLGGNYFGLYPYEIKTKFGSIVEFPLSTFRCFWERIPFSGGLPMRITPYFYVLDYTRKMNRLGHPVMFYLHPWEFDSEHVKVALPANRKFMHYCNLESTAKKIMLLLERMEFSTIEDVLELRKTNHSTHSQPIKYDKYHDGAYFKSVISFCFFIVSLALGILITAYLMKQYAFLLILILFTIFYWPWGLLFKRVNALFK
jgi:polysaccharide deacetylase family protein (PEP-CTERM system associated)